MTRKSPMHRHTRSMHRHVVVVAEERNSAWRHVFGLLESRFYLEIDRGTAHLMVGSPAGVEVVVGNFFQLWQGFLTMVEDFYDEDRIAEKGTQTLDGLPEK